MQRRKNGNGRKASQPKPKPKASFNKAGMVQSAYRRMKGNGVLSPDYELACSTADPWSCTTCIPDGAPGASCYSFKEKVTLVTGAGGSCAGIALHPQTRSLYAQSNFLVGASPVFPGATLWSPATSAATAQSIYASERVISAGLRCTYIGNTQTDAGIAVAGIVPSNVPLSTFTALTLTQAIAFFSDYKTYPLRNGIQVTWRSSDFEDMAEWKITTGTSTAFSSPTQAPYLLCLVYGANASQSIFDCDMIVNLEGRLANQNFLAGGVNTGNNKPSVPGWYEKVKLMVRNIEPIIPVIGGAVSGFATGGPSGALLGAFGALSNGLAAPGQLAGKKLSPRFR